MNQPKKVDIPRGRMLWPRVDALIAAKDIDGAIKLARLLVKRRLSILQEARGPLVRLQPYLPKPPGYVPLPPPKPESESLREEAERISANSFRDYLRKK